MDFIDYWNQAENFWKDKNLLPEFFIEQNLTNIEPLSVLVLNKKFFNLKVNGTYPIVVTQITNSEITTEISWLVYAVKDETGQSGIFLSPNIKQKSSLLYNSYKFSEEQELIILNLLNLVKNYVEEESINNLKELLEKKLHIGFFWNIKNVFADKNILFSTDIEKYINIIFNNVKEKIENNLEKFKKKETNDKITEFISNNLENSVKLAEEVKEDNNIPEDIQLILQKELKKLEYMNPASPDYSHQLTFVDTVKAFPFNKFTHQKINPKKLLETLNQKHFGLTSVKESIVEHIALQNWTDKSFGDVICLIGPPGVGKSSIANILAKELNRKFIKMALGGLSDESELRGHRRTYLGSEPGRLVKELIRIESIDPLIVLDEIDKLSSFKGSPADALLEILDPEQNDHFVDRYFGFPIDISKSLFICTANYEEQIAPPLKDRMNIIRIDGYSQEEQFNIGKNFLIPKYQETWKLPTVKIDDDVINSLTKKKLSGIRDIEKSLRTIFKKSCYILQSEQLDELYINMNNIKSIINFSLNKSFEKNEIGFR